LHDVRIGRKIIMQGIELLVEAHGGFASCVGYLGGQNDPANFSIGPEITH